MPQTTYMPLYTASYPILAKVQKPGGVTVLSAVGAGDVPNKPTYAAGTIQMTQLLNPEAEEQSQESGSTEAVTSISSEEEVQEEVPRPRNKRK